MIARKFKPAPQRDMSKKNDDAAPDDSVEFCQFEPNPKAHTDQASHDLDVLTSHCVRYDLGAVYRL